LHEAIDQINWPKKPVRGLWSLPQFLSLLVDCDVHLLLFAIYPNKKLKILFIGVICS
jgi:hypothetical protein